MQENSSLSKQVFFSFWCWKWERTVKEKHPASTLPDWRFTILSQPGLAGSWGKDTVRWEHFGDVLNISRCAYGAQLVLETYCKEMITRLFLRQLEKVLIFRHTFSSLTVTNTNSNMMKVNEISDHSKTSQKIGVDHLLLLNPISHFVTDLGFRKVIIWMILSLQFFYAVWNWKTLHRRSKLWRKASQMIRSLEGF